MEALKRCLAFPKALYDILRYDVRNISHDGVGRLEPAVTVTRSKSNDILVQIFNGLQPERHPAAAAIAIGLGSKNAFLFSVATNVPGSHLGSRQTVVGDLAAILRSKKLQPVRRHFDQIRIFIFDSKDAIDNPVSLFVVQPKLVRFRLAVHIV